MLLNTWVLVIASRQGRRPDVRYSFHSQYYKYFDLHLRSRTNVHYLVFHLTIADTITCFITLPMETIWRATIEVK